MESVAQGVIATHAGLRGRPGAGLDRATMSSALAGLLRAIADRGLPATLAVGRDERPSGVQLSGEVIELAVAIGARVLDLGVVSTPATKLIAREYELGGGVMVTGSHLGPEWNGLKLFAGPDYWPLDAGELSAAGARGRSDARSPSRHGSGRVERFDQAAERHAAAVCSAVDADAIGAADLKVTLTGGSRRAGVLALERLRCALAESGDADLTLGLDADGDRLQLADERGRTLDPEATLPLVAIARRATRIVKGADSSRMVEVMAKRQGWEVSTTAPGEVNLLRGLAEWGGEVGGEGNGGAVVPDVGMARDGLAASAAILELVARSGSPLSELARELPSLARRRSTLPWEGEAAEIALGEVAQRRAPDVVQDPREGIRIERREGWALVRRSATEPLLRITVEAFEAAEAEALHDEVLSLLARPRE